MFFNGCTCANDGACGTYTSSASLTSTGADQFEFSFTNAGGKANKFAVKLAPNGGQSVDWCTYIPPYDPPVYPSDTDPATGSGGSSTGTYGAVGGGMVLVLAISVSLRLCFRRKRCCWKKRTNTAGPVPGPAAQVPYAQVPYAQLQA